MYAILMLGVNNAINKILHVYTWVKTFKSSLLDVLKVQLFFSMADRIFLISPLCCMLATVRK